MHFNDNVNVNVNIAVNAGIFEVFWCSNIDVNFIGKCKFQCMRPLIILNKCLNSGNSPELFHFKVFHLLNSGVSDVSDIVRNNQHNRISYFLQFFLYKFPFGFWSNLILFQRLCWSPGGTEASKSVTGIAEKRFHLHYWFINADICLFVVVGVNPRNV